ncbi:hypothetical protein [Actinomadura flavalba]|uniref:hypothetical protein n=1 Tax=Actinomadura flavalba TaxID=1120938 RepID=UPI0003667683|nr:hypothetical protein [Actinomadura flavalba]
MTTRTAVGATVACLAVLSAAACGGDATTAAPAAQPTTDGSVRQLTELAGYKLEPGDYNPLRTPADARAQADLIVSGTVEKVIDGIRVTGPSSEGDTYTTFVLKVDKVLDGDRRHVLDGRVYVAVATGTAVAPAKLSALNPRARTVAVLEDLTGWKPDPESAVQRPAGVPAKARLFSPFTDGFWLQGGKDTQMFGITAQHSELPAGWKKPRTVDQFTAAFGR